MPRRRSVLRSRPGPSRPPVALLPPFFLYIDVRILCRLFLSARMGLYDVPSHRAVPFELSSLLSFRASSLFARF